MSPDLKFAIKNSTGGCARESTKKLFASSFDERSGELLAAICEQTGMQILKSSGLHA